MSPIYLGGQTSLEEIRCTKGKEHIKAYCSNLYTVTIGILAVNAMGIENAVDWSIITVICLIPAGKYLWS